MAYTIGKKMKSCLTIRNETLRQFLAEFLGTFVLMIFGDCSVAQYKLFDDNLGTYLSVNWSWGIAVMMGVYVCGGVSGGHINPAVTVAQTILGRLNIGKCFVYMAGQYLGAFVASAVVYGVYYDALVNYELVNNASLTFDGNTHAIETAGIWATYPADFVGWGTCLGDQIVGTGMLVLCVMAITDKYNMKADSGVVPLAVGLSVVAIGMALGSNCGYAINPARDLGPRIFTAIAGWGEAPFAVRDYNYFWIPVVGPHIGAIVGAWLYLLCVGIHLEAAEDEGYDGGDVYKMTEIDQKSIEEDKGHVNKSYM